MVDSVEPARRWSGPAVRTITSAPCAPCHSDPGDGVPVVTGLAGVVAMKKGLAGAFAAVLIAMAAHADDARDVGHLNDVMNQRLENQRAGVEVEWLNPFTGNRGTIIILGTDMTDPELPCRTYRRTTERLGAAPLVVEGRACRVEPGLWQRNESAVSAGSGAGDSPVARARPEPREPPPEIPPPGRKPDPDIFFASVPTPSDYR